uniref:Uncharacterized protein n=1 Tax=Anguilla anguilla TaxID=7936 RepID=A0A0E9QGH9_ANGAN
MNRAIGVCFPSLRDISIEIHDCQPLCVQLSECCS